MHLLKKKNKIKIYIKNVGCTFCSCFLGSHNFKIRKRHTDTQNFSQNNPRSKHLDLHQRQKQKTIKIQKTTTKVTISKDMKFTSCHV